MRDFAIGLIVMTLTCAGSSAAWAQASQVPTSRTLVKVYTYSTYAVVKFSPSFSLTYSCGTDPSKTQFAAIDWASDSGMKNLFATALVAKASGDTVGFGLSGCYDQWSGGIPRVYRIEISD